MLLLPPLVVNICKISLLCRPAVCEPERRKRALPHIRDTNLSVKHRGVRITDRVSFDRVKARLF